MSTKKDNNKKKIDKPNTFTNTILCEENNTNEIINTNTINNLNNNNGVNNTNVKNETKTIDINVKQENITDNNLSNININNFNINYKIDSKFDENNLAINHIEYKCKIKHIYHFSDLHIHLYKRHQEYKNVFKSLLQYLKSEKEKLNINSEKNVNIPIICIITGDILHSKSDLSPECIQITYNLFKELGSIMPVFIIPGNHDLNMNNKNRLDSLTPIIGDLPKYYPIHYLHKTGVWKVNNLVLSHASIFDYYIIEPSVIDNLILREETEKNNNSLEKSKSNMEKSNTKESNSKVTNTNSKDKKKKYKKVILYHGRVNGAELFNGTTIKGESNRKTKTTITPSNFENYDLGLLGDIHKHQFLNKKNNIAYAGSLIQQNIGESMKHHGLIKWNVSKCKGEFVEIQNDYGYYTFFIKDNKNNYLKKEEDGTFKPTFTLPKNLRIRILYTNTTEVQIKNFIALLKEYHNIIECSYHDDESNVYVMDNTGNTDNNENSIEDMEKKYNEKTNKNDKVDKKRVYKKELNITDVDYQNKLLVEQLKEYEDIEESDIELIMKINRESNKIFDTDELNETKTSKYKLLQLEFTNLFSYGANNKINFNECNGIVGIVAANHMGKSAILDILLFALFDKFPRRGNIKDIINNRKSNFNVKLDLQVGNWVYTISKEGVRTQSGVGKSKCYFRRRNIINNRIETLEKDTIKQTKEYIQKIFGSYDDMINTNFSIQTNSTGFIDAENTARRKELERILRFDFINELVKTANDQYRKNKIIYEHLQKTMPPELIKETIDTVKEKESNLKDLENEKDELINKNKIVQDKLDNLNKNIIPNINEKIEKIFQEINIKEDELKNDKDAAIEKKRKELENQKTELVKEGKIIFKKIKEDYNSLLKIFNDDKKFIEVVKTTDLQIDFDSLTKLDKDNKKKIKDNLQKLRSIYNDYKDNLKKKINEIESEISELQKRKKGYKLINDKLFNDTGNSNDITNEIIIDYINKAKLNIESIDKKNKLKDKLINEVNDFKKEIKKIENKIKKKENENNQIMTDDLPPLIKNEFNEFINNNINYLDKLNNLKKDLLKQINLATSSVKSSKSPKSPNSPKSPKSEKTNKLPLSNEIEESVNNLLNYTKSVGWINKCHEFTNTYKENEKQYKVNETKIGKYNEDIKAIKDKIILKETELNKYKYLDKELDHGKREIKLLNIDLESFKHNEKKNVELVKLNKDKEKIQNEYLDIKIIDNINNVKELLNDYKSNDVNKKSIKNNLKELSTAQKELDDIMEDAEKNSEIQQKVIIEMNIKLDLDKQIETIVKKISIIRDKISELKGQLDKMKKDCVDKIEKEKMMNIYRVYRDCLKVIPMQLIGKIKPVLERKVNDLLTTVTNFTLKFEITDSRIEIYLNRPEYNNNLILINNSSGFERFISSLAIRLALMEISQLPSPNLMAIDEGWSCFDNENINNMQTILDHLVQKFDFILTISHLQIIRQHCDIQIGLKKDEHGFSMVNYG